MAPSGSHVTVRLVWLSRVPRLYPRFAAWTRRVRERRRRRDDFGRGGGAGTWFDAGDGEGLVALVMMAATMVLAVVLLWLLVIPLLLVLVDAVVVAVAAVVVVVSHVLFRRPWHLEVRDGEALVGTVAVVGWRAARRRREEILTAVAAGVTPASLVDDRVA